MITIIYAHPYSGSFNHAILEKAKKVLESRNETYQVIDLYQDQFNPVYTAPELANFAKGIALDPLVIEYQKKIKASTQLIFIFPIWWSSMPAIVKGFIDKVMLKNFAYEDASIGVKGLLTEIDKATVITTANSPRFYLHYLAGNPIQGTMMNTVLKSLGIKNLKWLHCGNIKKIKDEDRQQFLSKLEVKL